jgi:hypothetical protein
VKVPPRVAAGLYGLVAAQPGPLHQERESVDLTPDHLPDIPSTTFRI